MKKLKRLWRTFEDPFGIRGVRAHWRQYLSAAELEAISPFLRSLKEPSATYPCPRIAGHGCPRGVVVHGPDDIVAVCRSYPKDATHQAEADGHHRVRIRLEALLRIPERTVRAGFGGGTIRGQRGVWHVGTWVVNATDHRPVFSIAVHSRSSFDGAVGVLLITHLGPFVVMAPTLRFSGAAATEGLRQRGAALLALDDTVLLSGEGKLIAAGALAELLAAGGRRESAAIAAQGNLFRREQDFWVISFSGRSIHLKDSAGLGYIAELLRAPGKEVEALALVGQPASGKPQISVAGAMEMADEKTIRAVRAALQEREQELAGLPRVNRTAEGN